MRRLRVAVLYHHPLFGRGIAQLLSNEPRLEAVCLSLGASRVADAADLSGADAVVIEGWDDRRLVDQSIQALPPVPVAVVRLQDNAMEVYRDRRRYLPMADNLLEFMRELASEETEPQAPASLPRTAIPLS